MCSMPSTVWKRAARQPDDGQQADGEVGARALVVQRVEPPLGQALGAGHEHVGARAPRGDRVLLVEPQDVQQLPLEPLQRLRRRRSGNTSSAQTGVGHGQIVQFVVRSLTTLMPSLTAGSRSLPRRTGSRSDISPGALGPDSATRAARWSPSATTRSPNHDGTKSSVSSARVLDARALDVGVEPADVDELRAVPVRARRERADEILLARARSRSATIWSCCTLAPKPTTRSAKRARVAASIARRLAATALPFPPLSEGCESG